MVLCLSPKFTERLGVVTGSGELLRPIHLQPLGAWVAGLGLGRGKQGAWSTEFQEVPTLRDASSESTPKSEGFLTLHTLGVTLVTECTG